VPDQQPRCTIVVPAFNNAHLTHECLRSLLELHPGADHEIIVVDDASSDETPGMVERFGGRVEVFTHAVNVGFARSCNDGAAVASGSDYLLFLNNDTVSRSPWIDTLIRYADAHPKAAIVGAKLLYDDGTIQHAGVRFSSSGDAVHVHRTFPAGHPAVGKSGPLQAVTGAVMLVRRRVFADIGGFDEGFLNSFEDIDLCFQARERGHEVHYCADAVVTHLETKTRDVQHPSEAKNHQRFRQRWNHRIEMDLLSTLERDGLVFVEMIGEGFRIWHDTTWGKSRGLANMPKPWRP
jgi:GT2 family glycosyltransferase